MADFTNSITTRMRRTFRYPEDLEDENEARDELDEEGTCEELYSTKRKQKNCADCYLYLQ